MPSMCSLSSRLRSRTTAQNRSEEISNSGRLIKHSGEESGEHSTFSNHREVARRGKTAAPNLKVRQLKPSQVQGVGASCDGLTVSVVYLPPACTSPTLLLYDTRGLLLPSPDSPFASHVLNTSSSLVTGVHWNPTIAATFCVTFADGALAMYTLGVASGNVGGANCDTLPPATGVVAISWSPKGKQMVAVKKDGSLTQVFGHSFKNAILTMCLSILSTNRT